uniref:NBR1 autophagy cargo receptor a n=1 Tax=Xiphophorus couchianus TaxID=32473 RepID=A0A3B5LAW1_9TELE
MDIFSEINLQLFLLKCFFFFYTFLSMHSDFFLCCFLASVCPSCILCEMCRHSHDPSHSLVRTKTPLSIPEHGMSGEFRFPRRGDRTVRKAERQRLKAERRQLKAEVKEIKKKLRLEKRGMQWSGPCTSDRASLANMAGPGVSHTSLVPTMAALFLDENLPDNTRLEPGTKFIKYWKMKNSGTISWTSETKLVFMWGNLGLASEERREVPVPLLLPGQVGVVSVAFVAPVMEGMYTSHWRLAHCGCQFGPRVWCSIVVDSGSSRNGLGHQTQLSYDLFKLEKVPNNTPVALTPCISPLPNDSSLLERTMTSQTKDESEITGVRKLFDMSEPVAQDEEKEEEISGAQFLCETVIRSLTLEEAPDHRPLRRPKHSSLKPQGEPLQSVPLENCEKEEGRTREDWDEPESLYGFLLQVSSQTSSVSSSDDYIIVLPDCFDTSRPLGESMYSSAMSQEAPLMERKEEETIAVEESLGNTWPLHVSPIHSSVNQMLCASQTLDAVTLTPEVVPPPVVPQPLHPTPVIYSPRLDWDQSGLKDECDCVCTRGQGGITEGLVKGALSVAASAYKALFTGPNCSIQRGIDPARQDPSMMAVLLEMGFKDQRLNQQLLRKHGYNLLHTVNELVQMAEESQNETADPPQ